MKKKANIFFITILPLIYILLAIIQKNEIGYFHLFSTEPGYSYMFNGLNISQCSFPWMVEHPGTPLSVMAFIIIEIAHFFHPHDTLMIDLFKNPEYYLNAIIAVLIALDVIVMFLMGYLIYNTSKNTVTAVFFQLTPFTSWMVLSFSKLIMVEHLILITMMVLIAVIYLYLHHNEKSPITVDKYLILFSILVGLICATKLLYISVAIIPFLLLQGYKKKGLYLVFTLAAFSIFAFAIFNRWVYFRDWFFNNLIHSGQYGGGPANVIEKSTFIQNIKAIFSYKSLFSYAFLITILSTVVYHFPFLKVRRNNDKFYRALLGVTLCMIMMIIITAKQYKYYYLFPALLLIITGLYLIIVIYTRPLAKLNNRLVVFPVLAVFIFFTYKLEVKKVFDYHSYNMSRKESYLKTMDYVLKNFKKDQPTLVLPYYYGAPCKEYGLFYGMAWCGGKMRNRYAPELIRLYPNIYFYHSWNNLFNYWDGSFSFISLLKKYQQVVLLSGDALLENTLYSKLHGINRQTDTKYKEVYFNETTNEKIYKLSYDSIALKTKKQFLCDAEIVDESKTYFLGSDGLLFDKGFTQSQEKSRSGIYSSRLTQEMPFGFTCYISEVSEGETYAVSVWRHHSNSGAGLVVTTADTEAFYQLQTRAIEQEGAWEKLKIEFVVPEALHNMDIIIYCWNHNEESPAYFDDLMIERLSF